MPRLREKPFLEFFDFSLARKEFLTALKAWLIIEIFCFVLMPGIQILMWEHMNPWLVTSLIAGVAGAILVALSSEFIRIYQDISTQKNKKSLIWLAQAVGWLGLAGVGLPLAIVGIEIARSFGSR